MTRNVLLSKWIWLNEKSNEVEARNRVDFIKFGLIQNGLYVMMR